MVRQGRHARILYLHEHAQLPQHLGLAGPVPLLGVRVPVSNTLEAVHRRWPLNVIRNQSNQGGQAWHLVLDHPCCLQPVRFTRRNRVHVANSNGADYAPNAILRFAAGPGPNAPTTHGGRVHGPAATGRRRRGSTACHEEEEDQEAQGTEATTAAATTTAAAGFTTDQQRPTILQRIQCRRL